MSWARLDDGADEELADLSHGAFRLFVCGLTYSRRRKLGGVLHREDLDHLRRAQRCAPNTAAELIESGRWRAIDGGGIEIKDFAQFNPLSSAERMRRNRNDHGERGLTPAKLEALRLAVFERDAWSCRYCAGAPDRRWLVLDHVIPTPEGPTTLENLVACCRSCNARKSSRTPDEAGMVVLPPAAQNPHSVRVRPAQNPHRSRTEPAQKPHRTRTEAAQFRSSRARQRAGSPNPNPNPVKSPDGDLINIVTYGNSSNSNSNGDGGEIATVWAAWLAATGRERCVLSAKRRRVISRALADYGALDVLDAVVGWQRIPFYRGENDQRRVWNDLEMLLRDAEHIERFRDAQRGVAPTAPPPENPHDRRIREAFGGLAVLAEGAP